MPVKAAKRKKFVELAEQRTDKAVKAIEHIGKLSNKSLYEFNLKDIDNIDIALRIALDNMKAAFAGNISGFKL